MVAKTWTGTTLCKLELCADELHLKYHIISPLLLMINDPPIQDFGENCLRQPRQMLNYLKKIQLFLFSFLDKPENLQFETSVVDSKACKGESISINCSADAVPDVTSYEILRNGSVRFNNTSGMWSSSLSSGGVFIYKCVANNSLGSTESENVTVTVNGKQSFLLTTEYCADFFEMYFLPAQSNVNYCRCM